MDRIAQAMPLDRADLFRLTALAFGPAWLPAIIEKDFWVCWVLRRLFEVMRFRPQLIFKGGTSLSKVYNAIERFSEDVDLSLSRGDLGFADRRDPEQIGLSKKEARRRLVDLLEECRKVIRERLVPEIRADFESVLGSDGWMVELDADDPQVVLFVYPRSTMDYGLGTYIRPAIRLEFGARSDDWPTVEGEIQPYAAKSFPQAFTVASKSQILTLDAVRTFWEKATLLHAEAHRPSDKPCRERLSRHYYDLYRLSRQAIGRKALARCDLLERVVKHKSFFFAQSWAHYETAQPGSFRIIPSETRLETLRTDYALMKSMIFGDYPGWTEILRGLAELEKAINASSS